MSGKTPTDEHAVQTGRTDWAALDAWSDEEVEAAALADTDASPSRSESTLRHMSRAKQEDEPDDVGLAYLDAIAGDPEGVARALQRGPGKPAAAE